MLAPELLQQIRRIQLKAGHTVTNALAGNYLSAFKGQGMEFDEVREYVPGDDVRMIDWNVTARMEQPYVKVLREEREMTLMLMVDVSRSQGFGTERRDKRETAAELAAVLAFLAIRNNDKVGLMVFSDHVERFIPPKKGRAHVFGIIRAVLTEKGAGERTDVGGALDQMTRLMTRRSLCFLISDFWAEGYELPLKLAARRHEVVCARVEDPRERTLPAAAGLLELEDRETGERVVVDAGDARVRAWYETRAKERAKELERTFRRAGCGQLTVAAEVGVATPLLRFLRQREHVRPRRRAR